MEMIKNKGCKYNLMTKLAMHTNIPRIKIEKRIGMEIPKISTNTKQGKHKNKCIRIYISLRSSLIFEAFFLKA